MNGTDRNEISSKEKDIPAKSLIVKVGHINQKGCGRVTHKMKPKNKQKCSNCGKKIGRADRMKKKLIEKTSFQFSEQFKQEYEERKDWCTKCLMKYFKPKFKEASKQLKDKVVPERFKKIIEKAEKII